MLTRQEFLERNSFWIAVPWLVLHLYRISQFVLESSIYDSKSYHNTSTVLDVAQPIKQEHINRGILVRNLRAE